MTENSSAEVSGGEGWSGAGGSGKSRRATAFLWNGRTVVCTSQSWRGLEVHTHGVFLVSDDEARGREVALHLLGLLSVCSLLLMEQ